MQDFQKTNLLEKAKTHVDGVIGKINEESELTRKNIDSMEKRRLSLSSIDRRIEAEVLDHSKERLGELEHLMESPYFVRCDVAFAGDKETKSVYFGKFQSSNQNIYSWTSPAAVMRFETVGPISYSLPNGQKKAGEMARKDQFMIVGGQIVFMASEAKEWERTLVHQEHLSNRKSGFMLPEIVERMEKAQDEVIRAAHTGSFLIAGPAGSGKTTLAFHRIAYLTQSPDTAALYPGHNIIVFVQDKSTQAYFSALLPQLGINNVTITTWADWALELLGLNDFSYVFRFGDGEKERDEYEFSKLKAMRQAGELSYKGDPTAVLKRAYSGYFSAGQSESFEEQLGNKLLDSFDLTILLKNKLDLEAGLGVEREVVVEDKRGKLTLIRKMVPLKYSLIVLDEAENYLADQIKLIKECIGKNQSILYVGDLAQQTRLGTIKSWNEAGEEFATGRKVVLEKVYRNTRQILDYIRSCGYEVNIPLGLNEGPPVEELDLNDYEGAVKKINQIINENQAGAIGILHNDGKFAEKYRNSLAMQANVHLMTTHEAQGVEFDVVILLNYKTDADYEGYPADLATEKRKVDRDLKYVALTRSMRKLYVVNAKKARKA